MKNIKTLCLSIAMTCLAGCDWSSWCECVHTKKEKTVAHKADDTHHQEHHEKHKAAEQKHTEAHKKSTDHHDAKPKTKDHAHHTTTTTTTTTTKHSSSPQLNKDAKKPEKDGNDMMSMLEQAAAKDKK
tara:strand:+ start:491 stop:874 length:384 start_codon:yes stop_codon:yes gene_type:complete